MERPNYDELVDGGFYWLRLDGHDEWTIGQLSLYAEDGGAEIAEPIEIVGRDEMLGWEEIAVLGPPVLGPARLDELVKDLRDLREEAEVYTERVRYREVVVCARPEEDFDWTAFDRNPVALDAVHGGWDEAPVGEVIARRTVHDEATVLTVKLSEETAFLDEPSLDGNLIVRVGLPTAEAQEVVAVELFPVRWQDSAAEGGEPVSLMQRIARDQKAVGGGESEGGGSDGD